MKTWLKRIALAILLILVGGTVAFVAWSLNPLAAMPEAVAALESDADVLVTDADWMIFTPVNAEVQTGVIYEAR